MSPVSDDEASGEDPRVAAALAELDRLDDAPLEEHVAVLSEAHRRLHALLAEPAPEPPTRATEPPTRAPEPPVPAPGPPAGAPS